MANIIRWQVYVYIHEITVGNLSQGANEYHTNDVANKAAMAAIHIGSRPIGEFGLYDPSPQPKDTPLTQARKLNQIREKKQKEKG